MIAAIRIRGLGPHYDTEVRLSGRGVTEIAGRSEIGKTTLEDAIAFVLWGWDRSGRPMPRQAMHDEAPTEEIRVELELVTGSTLARSLRFAGEKEERKTIRIYNGQEYGTEKAWLGAIGKLGANPEGLRQALVPLAWVPLAQGAGGGRPLRDLLASLLPPLDREAVVRQLMAERGYEFRRGDAVHDADAEDQRRRAKRERDRWAGQVEHGRTLLAQGQALEVPEVEDVGAARGVLEMAQAWDALTIQQTNYRLRLDQALEASHRIAAWDARAKELGDRPVVDVSPEALAKANAELSAALEVARRLATDVGLAKGDLNRWTFDLGKIREDEWHPAKSYSDAINAAARAVSEASRRASDAPTHCPTCQQLWRDARRELQRQLDEARAAKVEAEQAFEAEAARRSEERAQRIAKLEADVARVQARVGELDAEIAANARRIAEATTARDALRDAARPAEDWEAARRMLGRRPDPVEPLPEPQRLSFDRPTAEQVEAARAVVEAAGQATGARRERERLLGEGRKLLDVAEGEYARAEAEVDRLEALVAVVRAAPTEALRRGAAAAFGDLGPVSLEFADDGGCSVLIDGRPWYLASDGRQIVADVRIRHAIRRVLGVPLPLVIDRAQDVGGQPIPTPAPAIVLRTDDGLLRSSASVRGAA